MSTLRPSSSTIKDPIRSSTLLKPLHANSESDDDDYVLRPDSATSTSPALLSPSLSLSSSSTLHYKASGMTDHHSRSSMSSTNINRHFYSSVLGRPPGSQKRKSTPTPTPSSSFPMTSSPNKTIPMKELQKVIADLKKENFDLKLRLYHLEQQTEKDMDKCWLEDENQRLQLALDDRIMQVEKLERTVSSLLTLQQQPKSSCDASTQAALLLPTPTRSAIDTSSESRSHVVQSYSSPFSAPVLPTFPADPASFGLPPSSAHSASAVASARSTTAAASSTIDVATMVDRFQNVHLASPKVNRRHSSAAPTASVPDDHGRVTGWLDRIPIPSFISSSPTSYTSPTYSH